jgi:hypothetical protein
MAGIKPVTLCPAGNQLTEHLSSAYLTIGWLRKQRRQPVNSFFLLSILEFPTFRKLLFIQTQPIRYRMWKNRWQHLSSAKSLVRHLAGDICRRLRYRHLWPLGHLEDRHTWPHRKMEDRHTWEGTFRDRHS